MAWLGLLPYLSYHRGIEELWRSGTGAGTWRRRVGLVESQVPKARPGAPGKLAPLTRDGELAAAVAARNQVRFQQLIQLCYDLEGVGYVDYVGFAAGPAAVGVERDGAALGDEAPADYVRLLAVAAGGKAFGMAGRCAGLADLVEVRKKGKNGVPFAALVDQMICCCRAMRPRR
jgi:hypothetical protein